MDRQVNQMKSLMRQLNLWHGLNKAVAAACGIIATTVLVILFADSSTLTVHNSNLVADLGGQLFGTPDDPPHGYVRCAGPIESCALRTVADYGTKPASSSSRLLTIEVGSMGDGYDKFEVQANGECSFRFREWDRPIALKRKWRTAFFSLTAAEIQQIRNSIHDNKILALNSCYYGECEDGTQIGVVATNNGRIKTIVCHNFFPIEIIAMYDQIRSSIFVNHRNAIDAANESEDEAQLYYLDSKTYSGP